MKISFDKVHTLGSVVAETDLYKQYHFAEMLIMYDSNYIEFKRLPSLVEFKETEVYLENNHLRHGQKHVKFYFPESERLPEGLEKYVNECGYEIGFMELYAIQPGQFPEVTPHQDIEVQVVTERSIEAFLELNYKHSLENGINFAAQKRELIQRQFNDPVFLQLLAFYKGDPTGYVHVIISDDVVEIDDLNVEEDSQKKGIGSRLQKAVMDAFPEKTIILIADGEDTPKEMYKRQNYQFVGFRYEVLKTFGE